MTKRTISPVLEIFPRKKRNAQTLSQTRRDERLLLCGVFFDVFLFRVDEMRTKFPGASFLFVLVVCFFFPFLSERVQNEGRKNRKNRSFGVFREDPPLLFPALSLSFSLTLSLSLERSIVKIVVPVIYL